MKTTKIVVFGLVSCLTATSLATTTFFEVPKYFYTLTTDSVSSKKVGGPVYDGSDKSTYVGSVFRNILTVANRLAAADKAVDPTAYWTFLTGALIVPFHESRLTHFRSVPSLLAKDGKSICSMGLNGGQYLSSNKALFEVFKKMTADSVIEPCADIDNPSAPQVQMLGSTDYFSNGIMQVAMNWHVPGYVATGYYLKVFHTLKYGLGKYRAAFGRLYKGYDKYACLKDSAGKRIYGNIVKAAWAGDYNSGNDTKSCRFTVASDPWAANDKHFKESFDAITTLAANNVLQPTLYSLNLQGQDLEMFKYIVGKFRGINHGADADAAFEKYVTSLESDFQEDIVSAFGKK